MKSSYLREIMALCASNLGQNQETIRIRTPEKQYISQIHINNIPYREVTNQEKEEQKTSRKNDEWKGIDHSALNWQ